MLNKEINSYLSNAMLNKDKELLNILRLIKSEFTKAEKDGIILDEITEDLPSKISGYSELADENLISINDLVALVTNQEYENLMLKKEIESLKKQLLQYGKKA